MSPRAKSRFSKAARMSLRTLSITITSPRLYDFQVQKIRVQKIA
jgi:hypothetical protein